MSRAHARLHLSGWDLLHHALVALTIAAGVLVLEQRGWLGWLDAAMLRIAASSAVTSSAEDVDTAIPTLLLIDGVAYERDFSLRSPLDRATLEQGLSEILAAQPKVVLVDLQLEPTVGESGDRPLDKLLTAAAIHSHIVLPLPEMRSKELDRNSMAWMKRMCAAGVAFGSAQLLSHFGAVVRLSRDPYSMSAVVQRSGTLGPQGNSAAPSLVCQLASHEQSLGAIWEFMTFANHQLPPKSDAIRPSVVTRIWTNRMPWRRGEMQRALEERGLHQLVVVGGGYDSRDAFLLLGHTEVLPGVLVHAVAIDDAAVAHESHAAAWAIDILIGTVAGALFQLGWAAVRIFQRRPTVLIRWRVSRRRQPWKGGFMAIVLGLWASAPALVLWATTLALAMGPMLVASSLLEHRWWLNPGPLILGMALHAQLLAQHSEHHPVYDLRSFMKAHPLAMLQAAIGVSTVGLLAAHL